MGSRVVDLKKLFHVGKVHDVHNPFSEWCVGMKE